jgi:hypothetical protein
LSILQNIQPVLNESNDVPTTIHLEEPIFYIDGNGTNEFESNTFPEGVFPYLENPIEKRILMFHREYQDKRELHSQQKQ